MGWLGVLFLIGLVIAWVIGLFHGRAYEREFPSPPKDETPRMINSMTGPDTVNELWYGGHGHYYIKERKK